MHATQMQCQGLRAPLAVFSPSPTLRWTASGPTGDAAVQTAYRIQVATTRELLQKDAADLWDSGRVDVAAPRAGYGGSELNSFQRVWWRVQLWDGENREGAWSAPAEFGVGHLAASDWEATWIGAGTAARHPAPLLRRSFDLTAPPARATLYASALGLYEVFVNGRRVGDQVLAPEWSSYHKRVFTQSYDVSDLLRAGPNCICAVLADGWYAGRVGLSFIDPSIPEQIMYGDRLAFLAEIRGAPEEGSTCVVATDKRWRFTLDGPILSADILDGESVDARREMAGWLDPEYDDSSWARVSPENGPRGKLVPQPHEPIRVLDRLSPIQTTEPARGVCVVNFGQNLAGWVRLRLREDRGHRIVIKHGERLTDGGRLYTENLRSARQTDTYICAGGGEWYEPRFTFHGFQYAEIHGLTRKLEEGDIQACAIWSSGVQTGRFECSSDLMNTLFSNVLWTQRDNIVGVPTDCPQRDERLGWTGDIQVFTQTGCYNMDMEAFLMKWLQDLVDDQAADGIFPAFAPHPYDSDVRFSGVPAWGDAGPIVAWKLYVNYANTDALRLLLEPSRRWVDWIRSKNPDNLWKNARNNDYGEWLNADTFALELFPKGRAEMPKDVFATVYYYHSTMLLARMARILGNDALHDEYAGLGREIRGAFHDAYVDEEGRISGDTQAGYVLAAELGLLDPQQQVRAFQHLLRGLGEFDGHLSTGFLATVPALRMLTRFGEVERAYGLVEATTFPSWGYTIERGATTIWERWDGWTDGGGFQDPGMNSFCHYAIGGVGEWLYSAVLGIVPDEKHPGYEEFDIRPYPGGSLSRARGSYDSIRGRISVEWTWEAGRYALEATVPTNTRARIWVRTDDSEQVTLEGDTQPKQIDGGDGFAAYLAPPGTYRFTAPLLP